MRLIHTKTLELVEFFGNNIPEYAILSHTWGQEEVTFKDWKRLDAAKGKTGFSKINMACRQALADGLKYLWVDTNCIDKRASAELSEAINSMFSWYKNASICYAYLSDVEARPSGTIPEEDWEQFRRSRWFTRGWTLQELLAPRQMVFYAKDWSKIANRSDLDDEISTATGIPKEYLLDRRLSSASIAQRMSWLSRRETTRIEDMAYCMLGIFDINMPLLYGEGSKAFTRLQEEIIRTSTDHTIFCWTWTGRVPSEWASLLAPCPQAFMNSGGYVRTQESASTGSLTFTMTNAGLSIGLPVVRAFSYYFGVLDATHMINDQERSERHACVPIQECLEASSIDTRGVMRRKPFPPSPLLLRHSWAVRQLPLYVRSLPDVGDSTSDDLFYQKIRRHVGCSILLLFDDTHQVFRQSDPSATVLEDKYYDRISLTRRDQEPIRIVVSPGESFDPGTSLIMLDSNHHTNGVLIRLGDHEKSSAVFLGAELSPRKKVLRRFGGIIPYSKLTSATIRPEDLLDTSLNHLRNGSDKVSWIESNKTINYCPVTGIGFLFGDEVLLDNNSIFPVFIKYEGRESVGAQMSSGSSLKNDSAISGERRRVGTGNHSDE